MNFLKKVFTTGELFNQFTRIKVGDRLQLFGGYEMNPKWLSGNNFYEGEVIKFIKGQKDELLAVIRLKREIEFDDITGNILVLHLRYEGAKWNNHETVHVELCDFVPDNNAMKKGKWVESHASYRKL